MAKSRRRIPVAKQERFCLAQCIEDLQETSLSAERRAELEARKHRAEVAVVKRSIKSWKLMIRDDKRMGDTRGEEKHTALLKSEEARLKKLEA